MSPRLSIVRTMWCVVATALLIVIAVVSIRAHHSLASQFDESKPLTLQGIITKVDWVNPHVFVYLDVADKNGAVSTWSLETLPPGTLRRSGLRSEMLGTGQNVTVLAYQARTDPRLAFLRKITFADGRDIVIWVGDIKTVK